MNPDVAVGYLQIGIAVILAFLGGFVLIKRPESQPGRLVAVLCFLNSVWIGIEFFSDWYEKKEMLKTTLYLQNSSKFFISNIIATLVCFSWYFPHRPPKAKRKQTVLIYSVALIFSLFVFSRWDPKSAEFIHGKLRIEHGFIHHPLYFGFIIFGGLYALGNLLTKFRELDSPSVRLQLVYVTLGLGLSLIIAAIFSLVLPAFNIRHLAFLGTLAPVIGFGFIIYAIVKYRAMEIDFIIHRTLFWLVVSSIAIGTIYVMIYLLGTQFQLFSQISLGIIFIRFLFLTYNDTVQSAITRLFQNDQYKIETTIDRLVDSTRYLQGLEVLVGDILRMSRDVLRIPNSHMLIYYDDAATFIEMGLETKQPTNLTPDKPFFKWLVTFDQIVERERVQFRSQHQEIREIALPYFNQVKTEVCVPFIHGGRILGILNLGRKSDIRWNLTARELGLLDRLRKSATLALENALLHQTRLDIQEKQIQAELLASASSSLAHSIKNPLGLLCANLDLLRESTSRFSNQEIGSALLDTEVQVRKIEEIINQIRNANIGPSELESLRLDLLIGEILYEQVDLSIETEIYVEPTEMMADQGQMRLALTNIIINACQAMKVSVDSSDDGAKCGKLGVYMNFHQNNQMLELKISDTGCGMSNVLINQVLSRPFVTKKKTGTGLGVWTAKKIIEAHSGKLDLESKERKGTIATIILPLSTSTA